MHPVEISLAVPLNLCMWTES